MTMKICETTDFESFKGFLEGSTLVVIKEGHVAVINMPQPEVEESVMTIWGEITL